MILAMVIDYRHGRKAIFGIFDQINEPQFPHTLIELQMVTSCSCDIHDSEKVYDMQLNLVDADNHLIQEIGSVHIKLDRIGIDELRNCDFEIPVDEIEVPKPGVYSWQLLANGKEVKAVRFSAVLIPDR